MADVNPGASGCGAATGNRKVSAPRAISRTNTPNPRDCVKLQAQTAAPFFNKPLKSQNFRLIYRRSEDVCLVVTVRRCSMLLDESVIDALNDL